ncbi:hypothetical protein LBMAG52_41360 [Planctomycetia bacterium]|nr:hypothetical protein LBMAG52_41360 [Planctomycetia bacterium]
MEGDNKWKHAWLACSSFVVSLDSLDSACRLDLYFARTESLISIVAMSAFGKSGK